MVKSIVGDIQFNEVIGEKGKLVIIGELKNRFVWKDVMIHFFL